jgi:hypothetical protein
MLVALHTKHARIEISTDAALAINQSLKHLATFSEELRADRLFALL